jgi:translation initiation factor IF-2
MTENAPQETKKRPPVVVVMGHVDHGKTSLLDYVRKANVVAREAGGITQAVAAYEITHAGEKITFIDTPGHEAFASMRSRGAQIADLAIVIVAADESIKPQTLEAINILQESKTPFVIAINKIDREDANVERVKNDFTAAGIYLEGYGGQISIQPISAKTGAGIPELLDLVLLTAEVENLTYNPHLPASGFVLEVRHTKQRGLEVSVIVKDGTLEQGSAIATASTVGKVKILEDFLGKSAKQLTPSSPAIIIGFEKNPLIGEEFWCGDVSPSHISALNTSAKAADTKPGIPLSPLELLLAQNKRKAFSVVLKAADAGSLEALVQIISGLKSEREIEIVASSIGDIVDNDIKFAASTGSVLIGFKVKISKAGTLLAQNNNVIVCTSDIVYSLIEQLQELVAKGPGAQASGELEVLAVFNQKRFNDQLIGGKIVRGMFKNKGTVRIVREGKEIATGKITSLRELKKDIESAQSPKEVGIIIDTNTKIEIGDDIVLS